MESIRMKCYHDFAYNMEYPVIIFEEDTGEVLECNYEAKLILGQQIVSIQMEPDKFMESDDFWEKLHGRKAIIWHRILLVANGRKHYVSGLINEFELSGRRCYMVLFELRSDLTIGSVTLEQIVNHAKIIAFHLYRKQDEWVPRYVSKNVNQYGYTSEQFYGGMIRYQDVIHPEDLNLELDNFSRCINGDIEDSVQEFRIVTETRQIRHVREQLHVVRDRSGRAEAIEILLFDITNAKKNQDENQYLKAAIEKSRSVVIVKEVGATSSRIEYISQNGSLLGMNVEAIRNGRKSTENYIYEEDRARIIQEVWNLRDYNMQNVTSYYRIVGDDHVLRWVKSEVTLIEIKEESIRIQCLMTDMTREKNFEIELENKQAEFEKKIEYLTQTQTDESTWELLQYISQEEIQKMMDAFVRVNDVYCVVVDNKGNLVTQPRGPVCNIGEFYDMLERPIYRDMFAKLNEELRDNGEMFIMDIDDGNPDSRFSGVPIMLGEQHVATWLICSFNKDETKRLETVAGAIDIIAKKVSQYIYDSSVVTTEFRRSKLAEMTIKQELNGQAILTDVLSHMDGDDNATLDKILERVGQFMKLSAVTIFAGDKKAMCYRCLQEWKAPNKPDNGMPEGSWIYADYSKMGEYLHRDTIVVYDSGTLPLELKRICDPLGITALMALPILVDETIYGYISFVEESRERRFSEREIAFAKDIRNVVQGIIARREGDSSLRTLNKGLINAYNYIQECVYIKDANTNKILFANDAINSLFEKNLRGENASCILPNHEIQHYDAGDSEISHLQHQCYIKEINLIMDIDETRIAWVDGRDAQLYVMRPHNL